MAILIVLAVWIAMVLLAPYILPTGSVDDLSGMVGSIDNRDKLRGMNPFPRAIYGIGDACCHQISDRSFYLNGNQMPFCSRDLGIFLGLLGGMMVTVLVRLSPPVWVSIGMIAPMALDGSLQLLTAYESSNGLRVTTGALAGAGVALLLAMLMRRMVPYGEGTE